MDGKLSVAADQLGSLGRYRSSNAKTPTISKLGGANWNKIKEKAKKSVKKVAIDLIKLYAERSKEKGYKLAVESINNTSAESWEIKNNKSLLDHVMNTERNEEKWEMFINETNKLDKVRKQSILSFIPDYAEYWHD